MSMTWEEAIALLNEQYETCKRIYDCSADQRKSYPNVPQFMEALGMALTALRGPTKEQVEKVWRGEWRWVGEDRWSDTYECSKCGKLSMNDYPFCPNCNSAMNDEAVQTVMERLEALKDADTDH